jgi:chaperonin GroEL (HSP60 family)
LNFLAFESKDEAPVVSEALLAPFKTLCRNRGVEGPPRIQNLHESYRETGNPWMGWDIGCDSIRHLASEDMVLDSLKCVLEIIRSSISLALLILNSNTLVVKDGIKR